MKPIHLQQSLSLSVVSIIGIILLAGSMIFAALHLNNADQWISIWLPFVIAGVAMTLGGVFLKK